jgi:hypothetical protein
MVPSGTVQDLRVLGKAGALVVGSDELGTDVYEISGEMRDQEHILVVEPRRLLSFDEHIAQVRQAFGCQFPYMDVAAPVDMWVSEVFPDHAIIEHGGTMYRAPYMMAVDGITFSPIEKWEEVERIVTYEWKSVDEKHLGTIAYAIKASDGSTWWLQFTSNAFKDREGEIFTTQSLHDYVDRHRDEDTKGQFWYRHIPGTKFGTVQWQAMVGRFLVQAGPFDNMPIGQAFKAFFEQYPNGHPDFAPYGWGTSHGYQFRMKDRFEDGIYNWLEIKESTVLPSHIASNPWSPIPVIINRSKKMNEQEKYELTKIGGQTLVDMVLAQGEGATKDLETSIDFKANGDGLVALKAAISEIKDAGLKDMLTAALDDYSEPEKEEKQYGAEPQPDPITRAEIAEALKAVTTHLQNEIIEASKGTAAAVTASITEAMQPLIESVKTIRLDDDTKIANLVEKTPAASIREMVNSALESKDTKIKDTSALAQAGPLQATGSVAPGAQMFPPFIQEMIQQPRS